MDERARGLAERVVVEADSALVESEARLSVGGQEVARVEAALGSPQRPLDERALRAKRSELAGDRLEGALDDLARPAAELLEVVA